MRSPADMEFIQIDITNACNMRCSNCTRFCGNHVKPFFMDFETFKRAVDSLEEFDGVTGIIGGEPTLHPDFECFARYMLEKFGSPVHKSEGSGKTINPLLYPQNDFIHTIHQREFDSEQLRKREDGSYFLKKHGAGLWSNMGATYLKYYEVIQDTFAVEYLNDHINPSYHQPGLFSRRDLRIPDEEWYFLRDKCWVQNTWSATITPKGAFFCEIAGALDMLFDGPGGWKIEPGWWKRKPEDFGDQLQWCEICGFALEGRTFTRDSQEGIDDVSPILYEKLKKIGSPKLKTGKIKKTIIKNGVINDKCKEENKSFIVGDRYIAKYEDRFHEKNSLLFQMKYKEIYIYDGRVDFGYQLNQAIRANKLENNFEDNMEWILLKLEQDADTKDLMEMIGKKIFNPGCLHLGKGYMFFSKAAYSLRKIGFDRIAHMFSAKELKDAWISDKVIDLSEVNQMTSLVRKSIKKGSKYAIWGAGMLGEFFAETVELSGGEVIIVIDKARDKIGKTIAGIRIDAPSVLVNRMEDFDFLLIAHHLCFEKIEQEAIEMGIKKNKIILPHEV